MYRKKNEKQFKTIIMELKKLDKAAKLYERVKQLDSQIIGIERQAILILDSDNEIDDRLENGG